MELSGKRVAVLAEDLYEDLELWYPLLRMREAGAHVFVVGPGGRSRRGRPRRDSAGGIRRTSGVSRSPRRWPS